MKKRIAVVAEYFPPRLGGDRRIFELMSRLSKKYDIHFLTLPPSYTLFIRRIDSYQGEDQILYEGMAGHRLHLPKLALALWSKSFLLAFAVTWTYLCLQMIKEIARLKPEVIIVNNTSIYTGLMGFISSKLLGKKLFVEYNDLEALYAIELVRGKVSPSLLHIFGRILVLVEDTIVKYSWKATAITEFIKNYAISRNIRSDITVIPDGVDTNSFNPINKSGEEVRSRYGVTAEKKLCVYAGRIEKGAGANIVLETARMLESAENIVFMVVGEGDPQIADRLSKCSNVILTGRVSKESVPSYLAAADIVLVPFPNNIVSNSVSPLKLFEALAMDKPVVASAVSGIREVLTRKFEGRLVTESPKEWASAVIELSQKSDNLVGTNGNNRKIVCEKYDWDFLAKQFDEVLEDGLGER